MENNLKRKYSTSFPSSSSSSSHSHSLPFSSSSSLSSSSSSFSSNSFTFVSDPFLFSINKQNKNTLKIFQNNKKNENQKLQKKNPFSNEFINSKYLIQTNRMLSWTTKTQK